MPFNGSNGTYTLSDTIAPATLADANELQAILDDIATALTNTFCKDGQSTLSAQVKGFDGTVALPGYSFSGDSDSGLYRIGANHLGIGVAGANVIDIATTGATVTASGTAPFIVSSTDAGAGVGPILDLYRNSASPATSDIIGSVDFNGVDSGAAKQLYARIYSQITDATAASEDAILFFQQVIAGTLTTILSSSATTLTSPLIHALTNVTNGLSLAGGTTGQRAGSPVAGDIRYNTTLLALEFYDGGAWRQGAAQAVPAGFKNLVIANNSGTPNTQIDVTADAVTTETTSNIAYRHTTVSVTINAASTGANALDTGALGNSTWYSVWIIYNPATDTVAGLASLSATAPTMPSGYTAKARLGWMITDGSAHFLRTKQQGRTAQYIVGTNPTIVPNIGNGVVGTFSTTSPTLATASITGVVPTTASRIGVLASANYKNGTASSVLVAPNTGWGGTNNGPQGSAGQVWPIQIQTTVVACNVWMELETTTIAWASSAAGGAISCVGWEDNI